MVQWEDGSLKSWMLVPVFPKILLKSLSFFFFIFHIYLFHFIMTRFHGFYILFCTLIIGGACFTAINIFKYFCFLCCFSFWRGGYFLIKNFFATLSIRLKKYFFDILVSAYWLKELISLVWFPAHLWNYKNPSWNYILSNWSKVMKGLCIACFVS